MGWTNTNKLGFGRFGVVYACLPDDADDGVEAEHARKRLQKDMSEVEEVRQRFAREIEILASLDHKNVMPVLDQGATKSGVPWFVMPRALDGSLKDAIDDGRSADPAWVETVFEGMLEGMAHAHESAVLHRDLKPRNVLLWGDQPKVSDFGIAKQLDLDETTLTRSSQELGTLRYMAPEQFASAKHADKPADVYALGKIFAHLISGNEPEPLKTSLEGVPEEYRFFASKCCRDDPDRRYPDATAALDAFRRFREGGSDERVLPPPERLGELEQIAEESMGTPDETDVLEALDQHVRQHPADEELNRRVLPRLSHEVVRAWAAKLPEGFREGIRAYDVHISGSGSLPFEYCDVVADFYRFVYDNTDDLEVKSLVATRLLDLGYSHNRFYVHDVVVGLLRDLTQPSDTAVAEEAIGDNERAAAWYAEAALKQPLAKPIESALRKSLTAEAEAG